MTYLRFILQVQLQALSINLRFVMYACCCDTVCPADAHHEGARVALLWYIPACLMSLWKQVLQQLYM